MKPKYRIAAGSPDGYTLAPAVFDAIERAAAKSGGIGEGVVFSDGDCPVCFWGHVLSALLPERYGVPAQRAKQGAFTTYPADLAPRMLSFEAAGSEPLPELTDDDERSIAQLVADCPIPGMVSDEAVLAVLRGGSGTPADTSSFCGDARISFARWCEALGVERGPDAAVPAVPELSA